MTAALWEALVDVERAQSERLARAALVRAEQEFESELDAVAVERGLRVRGGRQLLQDIPAEAERQRRIHRAEERARAAGVDVLAVYRRRDRRRR